MRGPRPPRLWTRLNFSVKFGLVVAVAGVLIAVIPLSIASRENRTQAMQRATDKAGIVANLVNGQERSLADFATGMSVELAPALTAGDQTALETTLARYSAVNEPADVVGVHGALGNIAVTDGVLLAGNDSVFTTLVTAGATAGEVVSGPGGGPWLLASSTVAGADESAFIARPMDATFLAALVGSISTSADAAAIAVLRGTVVVAPGSMVLDQQLAPGQSVSAGVASVLGAGSPAQVVDAGGRDAAVDAHTLGAGFAVVVSTRVSEVSTLWQPLAILLGLILVAIFLIVLIVQTDLQRPLGRLDRAVAALARDEYDVPVPHITNHEIGRLAASFEVMRRQLRATIAASRARAVIASELSAPQPLETALKAVCGQLRSATDADTAFVVVGGSERNDGFVISDGATMDVDLPSLLHEEGPIGVGHRHTGPDALLVGAAPSSSESATGMRDFCVAPLRMPHTALGVIGVARRAGDFTTGDASLLATAAEQVALALERFRFLAMMQRQASIDDLTGLYNHRFLVDYLGQQVALAERLVTSLAVLVIDLDHFKRVNDTYGHPVGDIVLSAFAKTLTGSIRRADLAARYGGEEFLVVMSNTTAGDARLVAEKIRAAAAAMAVPIEGGATVSVTVSVGGAAYPKDTGTAAELLATADAALYDAKHAGRNRVRMAADRAAVEDSSHATSEVRSGRPAQ